MYIKEDLIIPHVSAACLTATPTTSRAPLLPRSVLFCACTPRITQKYFRFTVWLQHYTFFYCCLVLRCIRASLLIIPNIWGYSQDFGLLKDIMVPVIVYEMWFLFVPQLWHCFAQHCVCLSHPAPQFLRLHRDQSQRQIWWVNVDSFRPVHVQYLDLFLHGTFCETTCSIMKRCFLPFHSVDLFCSGPLFSFDVHDDIRLVNDATVEKDEVRITYNNTVQYVQLQINQYN